ncbi:MAG: alpha/beta fold hydrolase [Microscillaceae bacterium]|nr:alpha/beta fold hydrolase [Microscillaceae bacterium]
MKTKQEKASPVAEKVENTPPTPNPVATLPFMNPMTFWQDWFQMWTDMQEFWQYASVATYKKPEWVSPNEVVGDLHCFKMRKFGTEGSRAIPTLILPPFAGHYSTIADFSETQSLVRHLMEYGIENVYSLDYNSATEEMRYYDIDHYLAELNIMIDDLGDKVNLIGLCQGGWFGAIFTARFPQKVRSLVIAGAPIDTKAGDGFLENMVDQATPFFFKNMVSMGQGLMDGKYMLQGFKSMNPMQHYWQKYLDIFKKVQGAKNDEKGLKKYEDFEIWYENTLKLPGKWYEQVINELFHKNNFIKGEFRALGQVVNPKSIQCPVYLLAGEKDEITLPEQVFEAKNYFGTPPDKLVEDLAPGGHIGLFMGSETLKVYWKKIAAWMLEVVPHPETLAAEA